MKPKTLKANGLLFVASVLWGTTFVAQRVGMDHMGPFLFSGLRLGLGGLAAGFITWGIFWMFADTDGDPNAGARQESGRLILTIGSLAAAAVVVLQIWEVAVTPRSVYRINRRKRARRKYSVLPTPFLARDPSTGKSYVGLGAVGTF